MGRAGPPPGPAAAAAGQQHRRARPAHPGDRPQELLRLRRPMGRPPGRRRLDHHRHRRLARHRTPQPADRLPAANAPAMAAPPRPEPAWTRSCPGHPKDAPAVVPQAIRVPARNPGNPQPAKPPMPFRHMPPRVTSPCPPRRPHNNDTGNNCDDYLSNPRRHTFQTPMSPQHQATALDVTRVSVRASV